MTGSIRRLAGALIRVGVPGRTALAELSHRAHGRIHPHRPPAVPRSPRLIVTLTTTPERLPHTEPSIASILTQQTVPDRTVLWLGDEMEGAELPGFIERFKRAGLEVRFAPDLGPHSKLVHSIAEFPRDILVTADDDTLYPSAWLEELLASYRRAPAHIHCHRARWMGTGPDGRLTPYRTWDPLTPVVGPSHRLLQLGVGGALFPPNSLADEVLNFDAMRRLCPRNDDTWFKAMALLRGTQVQKVSTRTPRYRGVRATARMQLWGTNVDRNDAQFDATFEAYDLFDRLGPEGATEQGGQAKGAGSPQST